MLHSRFRRDDGQVSLAVILLSIAIIAAAVGVFIFGEANDARGRAQKAADAASLAAARDVREKFIPAFALAHTPPPPKVGPAIPANPLFVLAPLGEFGRHGAYQFANKNESQLSSYKAKGNRFFADVQSNQKEVHSPVGSKARQKISAPGDAVAIIKTDTVHCHSTNIKRDPKTGIVISWSMVCTGNGHSARVNYFTALTAMNDIDSRMDEWRRLFEVRLEK
ncbi:pilus assembly protein TadG-related protein [Brevibacterium paucivorans]|uniref:pilus assembly protein TadG-related protein n=1 Tax=Brevibacterium paucivorans TaxID=170994 RepID=UPI0032194D09